MVVTRTRRHVGALCPRCFQLDEPHLAGFVDALARWRAPGSALSSTQAHGVCSCCGTTRQELFLTGRVGCADCYSTYRNDLGALLDA